MERYATVGEIGSHCQQLDPDGEAAGPQARPRNQFTEGKPKSGPRSGTYLEKRFLHREFS